MADTPVIAGQRHKAVRPASAHLNVQDPETFLLCSWTGPAPWYWDDGFAERLASHGHDVFAPSLRGHGGRWRLLGARIRDYVSDLERVPGMAPDMMLEPDWTDDADRIAAWIDEISARGHPISERDRTGGLACRIDP